MTTIEFKKFYASFKDFTLSKDDKDMAEHMEMEYDEWMRFMQKKEVPLKAFLTYCSSRIIDPFWLIDSNFSHWARF